MIAGSINVTGNKELMRNLDAVSSALRGKAIQSGLLAAGYVAEGHAKLYARYDTGFMRNSIYVKTLSHSGYDLAQSAAQAAAEGRRMLSETEMPDADTCVIACGAEYGIHNEFGTSRMSAQPFMRPALYNHQEEIAQAFGANVMHEIEAAIR